MDLGWSPILPLSFLNFLILYPLGAPFSRLTCMQLVVPTNCAKEADWYPLNVNVAISLIVWLYGSRVCVRAVVVVVVVVVVAVTGGGGFIVFPAGLLNIFTEVPLALVQEFDDSLIFDLFIHFT